MNKKTKLKFKNQQSIVDIPKLVHTSAFNNIDIN